MSTKCGHWSVGSLVVAMISPWPREWDYAELYRGMFGWDDVGEGFHSKATRKKVVKLLLDEIVRRKRWMLTHLDEVAEMDVDIENRSKEPGADEPRPPRWFEEYSWARNHSASFGDGDMRLYVEGTNCLFDAPIMCQWAIQDMMREEEKDPGKDD